MEVSTFELLVKPIAPRAILPANLQVVARRVVQGYFLTVSNLEDRDLKCRIEFFISLPDDPLSADAANRLIENNATIAVDVAGTNQFVTPTRDGSTNRYFGEFDLPANKTASVELLPILTQEVLENPEPQIEIRGYVELFVVINFPPIRRATVLLNPETRGTFLPNDFPANTDTSDIDFDQINYTLALASGKALNLLTPVFEPKISDLTTSRQLVESVN